MYSMTIIVAIDENNTMAIEGEGIPWDIEEDFNQYMDKVRDKSLLMGRKTFESTSQPINQPSVIMTTDDSYSVDNELVSIANSKEEAEELFDDIDQEIYNLGGSEIYSLFFDETDKMFVSHIDGTYEADDPKDEKKFPKISLDEWRIEDVEMYEEFQLITYKRADQ